MQIPLPLIFSVTRLPSNLQNTSHPLVLRTRTFRTFQLDLATSDEADAVWDTLKLATAATPAAGIERTYAFSHASEREGESGGSGWKGKRREGWGVYDPASEFARMGLGEGGRSQAWRVTKINSDFEVSEQTIFV